MESWLDVNVVWSCHKGIGLDKAKATLALLLPTCIACIALQGLNIYKIY